MVQLTDLPLAAEGLTSYRCKGRYGYIMLGAKNHADAWKEAHRSTDSPHHMEVWNGTCYEEVTAYE